MHHTQSCEPSCQQPAYTRPLCTRTSPGDPAQSWTGGLKKSSYKLHWRNLFSEHKGQELVVLTPGLLNQEEKYTNNTKWAGKRLTSSPTVGDCSQGPIICWQGAQRRSLLPSNVWQGKVWGWGRGIVNRPWGLGWPDKLITTAELKGLSWRDTK